jgi:hypothetical protein
MKGHPPCLTVLEMMGSLCFKKYHDFLQREEEEERYEMTLLNAFVSGKDDIDNKEHPNKKKRTTRTCKTDNHTI